MGAPWWFGGSLQSFWCTQGPTALVKKKRLDLLSTSIYVELLFKVLYNLSRIKPLQMHPDGSEPP